MPPREILTFTNTGFFLSMLKHVAEEKPPENNSSYLNNQLFCSPVFVGFLLIFQITWRFCDHVNITVTLIVVCSFVNYLVNVIIR